MNKSEFVIQDLLGKIYQEEFKTGKLPTQRALAKTYGVSRFTIQQAIKNLEEIGIVHVVHGSGIFVHKKWVKNPLIFNSLTRTPYDRIKSKMVELKQIFANSDEQKIFNLNKEDKLWVFQRIRVINYKIEQLEISKLPVSMFPDLSKHIVEHSIQKYVEQKGFRISHYITNYDPIATTKEQSKLLMCKRGTPAMQITNRAILEDGQVFEYSSIVAIDYSVTYIRPFDREIHRSRIDQ